MTLINLKHFFLKLIMVAISLLVGLAVLEIGLKFFGGKLTNKIDLPAGWIIDATDEWEVDPDLIFINKQVKQKINLASNQPSQKPLILILGDSFAQGNTVDEGADFASQMSQILIKRNLKHTILNVGTAGYGNDQEITLLKKILDRGILPKIVVWTFYVNDVFENGQQATFTINDQGLLEVMAGSKDFVYQRQQFYDAIPSSLGLKSQSSLLAAILHFYNFKILQQAPEMRNVELKTEWAYKKMKLEIALAYDLAKQYNFKIVPILIEPQSAHFAFERRQCLSDEIGYIDGYLHTKPNYLRLNLTQMQTQPKYKDFFDQITNCDSSQFFSTPSEDMVPSGFHHFNALGYKLFGQIVAETVSPLLSQTSDNN